MAETSPEGVGASQENTGTTEQSISTCLTQLREKLLPFQLPASPEDLLSAHVGTIEVKRFHCENEHGQFDAYDTTLLIPGRVFNEKTKEVDQTASSTLVRFQLSKQSEEGIKEIVTILHSTDDLVNGIAINYYKGGFHEPRLTLINNEKAVEVAKTMIQQLPLPS